MATKMAANPRKTARRAVQVNETGAAWRELNRGILLVDLAKSSLAEFHQRELDEFETKVCLLDARDALIWACEIFEANQEAFGDERMQHPHGKRRM